MKTKEEIQKEIRWGEVYTLAEFAEQVFQDSITPYDGLGCFHNGDCEMDISPFDDNVSFFEASAYYPYVCWYNK